ncbi:MAG TPA: hypothetical protein VNX28_19915, partial [Gemmataceae bacterium]|nr:hypothetical protein [Gemmataceae bacterium]
MRKQMQEKNHLRTLFPRNEENGTRFGVRHTFVQARDGGPTPGAPSRLVITGLQGHHHLRNQKILA